MRRFLSSKLTIVALVLAVVTLITGVAWATTSSGPASGPGNQLTSSVVEIQALPTLVEVGGKLQIAGAGFAPGETVLFEIVVGGAVDFLILQGGTANDAGAFMADTTRATATGGLPGFLGPGIYTIRASTIDGHVASAPLVVVEKKVE